MYCIILTVVTVKKHSVCRVSDSVLQYCMYVLLLQLIKIKLKKRRETMLHVQNYTVRRKRVQSLSLYHSVARLFCELSITAPECSSFT